MRPMKSLVWIALVVLAVISGLPRTAAKRTPAGVSKVDEKNRKHQTRSHQSRQNRLAFEQKREKERRARSREKAHAKAKKRANGEL